MKNTTKYTNKKGLMFGNIVEANFLPTPEELKREDEKVKITLSITKQSKDFFEKQAKKHNLKYQTMLRQVLDKYAKANS